jgi:hypothetical protein
MPSTATAVQPGRLTTHLNLQEFHSLKEELSQWRVDPEIQEMEKERPGGIILGFVRGLRLSARLIYAIREHLSAFELEVNWGHLLTEEGNSCSPECDIIIHLPGYEREWNGHDKKIMDFKFVDCRKAIAFISCKSFIKRVDRKYCQELSPFVDKVLLFAECCEPNAVDRLKRSAKSKGYQGFWYLYTCNQATCECTVDPDQWKDFLRKLRAIASEHSGRHH